MAFYLNFRSVFAFIVIMEAIQQTRAENTIQDLASNEEDEIQVTGDTSEDQTLIEDTIRALKKDNEIDICSQSAWNVDLKKQITVKTSNFGKKGKSYDANITCTVLFQGSRKCIPVINCKGPVKLRKRVKGSCREDYLLVSDGLGGEKDYCGNERLLSTKPTNSGKDLYLKFVTGRASPNPSFNGFKCTVSCESVNKKANPLQSLKKKIKILPNCVCGISKKDKRIVGGKTAKMFEFPWLVALVNANSRFIMCGGSIINDRHILTAAHCFHGMEIKPSDIEVLVHAHQLDINVNGLPCMANTPLGENCSVQGIGYELESKTDKDENTTRHLVKEIIEHPLYFSDDNTTDNDVAILKLATKINLKDTAVPICLPKRTSQRNTYKGKKVTVAGWGIGHKFAAATNRLLQKLEDMPIIDQKRCQQLMRPKYTITEHNMCAGFMEGGKDACEGDSGGPLWYTSESGQNFQIGIVSFVKLTHV